MLRTHIIATAATIALLGAAAGPSFAQSGPVLSGGGDDRTITYDGADAPRGNVVGGGIATVTGGGDNRVITYYQPVAPRTGLVASVTGGGDNRVITYAPVDASQGGGSLFAGMPEGVRAPALPGQRG